MKFNLVEDWRWVRRHSWSVRLMLISALLSGLEIAFGVMTAFAINPGIPPLLFTGLAALTTVLATIARFVAQKKEGSE